MISRARKGRKLTRLVVAAGSFLFVSTTLAEDKPAQAPLPNPLTLKQAIELAGKDHPDLELATSRLERSKASLQKSKVDSGFELSLNGAVQTVDQVAVSGYQDDSYATVLLSKRLLDFGRSSNRINSAKSQLEGEWQRYFNARQQRRLDIMAAFFDVILADLRYRVDDESMASIYVGYDKIRQRHELGQYSDVELLKHESRYRAALSKRVQSQSRQRATRAHLAIVMNRPDELADNLKAPILDDLDKKVPDYDEQLKKVLAGNPTLLAMQYDVTAAEKRVRSARAVGRPELNAELEANKYQRELGLRNDTRAGLTLKWPIYRGGERGARIAEADALLRGKRALLRQTEMGLKQKTLELLQRIELLQYRRQEAKTLVQYRDLKLDQNRALYELEVQTTLGTAMIGVTDAQWRAARTNYELALAWAELKALSGELVEKTAEEKYR